MGQTIPCYFHSDQLDFKPRYEWAFGEKIAHPEQTSRAENILSALEAASDLFEMRTPKEIPLTLIRRTHKNELLTLYTAARSLPQGHTVYPSVFLKSNIVKADPSNIMHAGSFCDDSGTPLNREVYHAATWSAACAVEAARTVLKNGRGIAFALSRPPGHHASESSFGGYCYLNNSALAAQVFRRKGRVVILDIDFHHGNGTQSIFWRDDKVMTVSLHGDPRDYYPFCLGFPSEVGGGRGEGYNHNIILPAKIEGAAYLQHLQEDVIRNIRNFAPDYLVVAAGFDTYERDPIGDFGLITQDYAEIGAHIANLGLPTAVIMEGGYYTPHIGRNVVSLLTGMREEL